MNLDNKIDSTFIIHASEVLGDTNTGLSGGQIVKYCNAYALQFNVQTPINDSNFGKFGSKVPNKRTALQLNLQAFNGKQQFKIINDLCDLPFFSDNQNVQNLKRMLFSRYSQFSTCESYIDEYEETGWERVDRAIEEMKSRLAVADTEEKCQAIGMIGRETLITVAQEVFVKGKHPTLDGVESSTTDAKRMLEAFLNFELKDASEKERKFARAAIDFANQLTHDRTANQKDAELCLVAVTSVAALIRAIVK